MKCLYPGCDRERSVGSSYCQWHQESYQSEGVIETSADHSSLISTADAAIESFSSTDDPSSSTNDYPPSDFGGFDGGESGGGGAGDDY
jgi:hypothetical protein